METDPRDHGCRVVTSEISARILIAAQMRELNDYRWTVVSGDSPTATQEGVEHVVVAMRREFVWSDFASFLALLRFFRRRRFSFVQTHTPKASLLALPAARLSGQRAIYTMHGSLYFRDNSRLANVAGWVFERWCCSWAHVVCMQSREDTEVLVRVRICPRSKVRYQGNGIDLTRFRGRPVDDAIQGSVAPTDGRPLVLNISRLVTEKGCLDFFAIAESLAGRADFVHVGPQERDQNDAVDPALIADLSARGIVRFLGDVADVGPYLYKADLFVLPSLREGIPRACVEAAACGVAVVAYNVRGVREVIPPDLGLLAPRGDVALLTGIVERLLADSADRSDKAQRCQRHVRATFDERFVVERLRRIYGEL